MIDVDVSLVQGEFALEAAFSTDARILGVFGPSGSGKSTLLNAVAGVLKPRRGHIRVGGRTFFDLATGVDLSPPRRRVGYVFQDALLFPHLSVRANLLYGYRLRAEDERPIEPGQVIEVLGIAGLLERKPATLSGGERQRVGLGRALLAQPSVLLFDEPLASLDDARKDEVLHYIERLRDTFAIPGIYVSHARGEIARLADAVLTLGRGRAQIRDDVDAFAEPR